MAGIMTFQIPEVLISQGSSYSIVVTNAGNATIKYYVEAEVSYGWCEFEPSILSGQSFRYLNSQKEWEDGADLVLSTKTQRAVCREAAPGTKSAPANGTARQKCRFPIHLCPCMPVRKNLWVLPQQERRWQRPESAGRVRIRILPQSAVMVW